MNDSSAFSGAMGFYDKTLSAADDVLRALIAALAAKSNEDQKKILENFAKYIAQGKKLNAVVLDKDRMAAFAAYAKKHDLSYYSAADRVTGVFNVIYRDKDELQVQTIAEEMRESGKPLFRNPQRDFSDFCREHADVQFQRIRSLDDVILAKQSLSAQGVDFALAKNADSSYIVVFDSKDAEAIQKSGMVREDSPAAAFNGHANIQNIRGIIEEKRRREEIEKENKRQKEKSERSR